MVGLALQPIAPFLHQEVEAIDVQLNPVGVQHVSLASGEQDDRIVLAVRLDPITQIRDVGPQRRLLTAGLSTRPQRLDDLIPPQRPTRVQGEKRQEGVPLRSRHFQVVPTANHGQRPEQTNVESRCFEPILVGT